VGWRGKCLGEYRNTYRILVEKPEGKRPLERLEKIIIKLE
jgi:hypothetical protein